MQSECTLLVGSEVRTSLAPHQKRPTSQLNGDADLIWEDIITGVLLVLLLILHIFRSNAAGWLQWLVVGLSPCIKCKHTAAP